MYVAAAGVVEQPIKQSPRSQGRQASCLNCSWCHLHTFQKSDWNIFLLVPRRQEILSLQSPASVLTQPSCPPERPLERHERMPASSRALVLLAGGFPLPLYQFLPHLGPLLHGHLMKPRAACLSPCIPDATQNPAPILQLLYLCSLASITNTSNICWLLTFLPWSLAVVLMAHHAAQWLPGWAQEICSCWPSQVDNRTTN